jgi:hypothetical protein
MQYVIPPVLHVYVHVPDGHDAVAPVAVVHAMHVAPHAEALFATQAPFAPHAFCPLGHWHVEPTHCLPFRHELPQEPQLALSPATFTHAEPQAKYGLGQLIPHIIPSQVAEPLVGTGHALHDDGPHEPVDELLTHLPMHSCVPDGQPQWPAWHVLPPAHANIEPHPPQLLLSFCSSTQAPPHGVYPGLQVNVHVLAAHAG